MYKEEYDDINDGAPDYRYHDGEEVDWREVESYADSSDSEGPPPLLRFLIGLGFLEWLFGGDV